MRNETQGRAPEKKRRGWIVPVALLAVLLLTGSVLMLSAGDDSAAVVEFARAHASHMAKAWVCSSGSAAAAFARLVEATS